MALAQVLTTISTFRRKINAERRRETLKKSAIPKQTDYFELGVRGSMVWSGFWANTQNVQTTLDLHVFDKSVRMYVGRYVCMFVAM